MNVTVSSLPKSEVKITVELTEEQMQKYLQKAAKQISQMVKIPGFRPGHAPLDVLKKHVREEAFDGHLVDIAVPETYGEAVQKEQVKAISRPKITVLQQSPLKYEAVVAVYPEVKVSGYEKVKIDKKEAKVENKEIEDVLAEIQKHRATSKEVERAAQKSDRVEIDFQGFDEGGAPLENTESKNHPVVIGEGSLVPGFEDALIGMNKGETKEFTVTFPKDYFHKPFQGKNVKFKATMNRVQEPILPEWTPEFIKQVVGEEKTLDEVKQTIQNNLQEEKTHSETVRRENKFLEHIVESTKVDVPESLIEEEIDGMVDEFKNELEGKGITMEQFLAQTQKEIKDLREERRKEATKRLTLRFGLQQIFEQDKIEVTPDDIKKEMEHVIGLYPANEQARMRKEYTEGSYLMRRLENKLKMDKLFEKYIGK
ncbi:trigger factor [Candidatus Peregrinibacteria bacterium]|nr:trigger factor [Candidatus Peregrinibacteria bacterium]